MLSAKRLLLYLLFSSLFLASLSTTTILLTAPSNVKSEISKNLFAQSQSQRLYPLKVIPQPKPNPLSQPKPQDLPTRDPNTPIYQKPLGEGRSIEVKPPNVDLRIDTQGGVHRGGVCAQFNPSGVCLRYEYNPK
jgi:hypothetical protein